MRVDVIRDVLDKQALDAGEERLGKVDGLVLEVVPGEPPRVTALRIGALAWAPRVGRAFGRVAAEVSRRFHGRDVPPWTIPWTRVRHLGKNVHLDVRLQGSPVLAWERWIRDRIIGRIPGADR